MKLSELQSNLDQAQADLQLVIDELSPVVKEELVSRLVVVLGFLRDIEAALKSYKHIGTALNHVLQAAKPQQDKKHSEAKVLSFGEARKAKTDDER